MGSLTDKSLARRLSLAGSPLDLDHEEPYDDAMFGGNAEYYSENAGYYNSTNEGQNPHTTYRNPEYIDVTNLFEPADAGTSPAPTKVIVNKAYGTRKSSLPENISMQNLNKPAQTHTTDNNGDTEAKYFERANSVDGGYMSTYAKPDGGRYVEVEAPTGTKKNQADAAKYFEPADSADGGYMSTYAKLNGNRYVEVEAPQGAKHYAEVYSSPHYFQVADAPSVRSPPGRYAEILDDPRYAPVVTPNERKVTAWEFESPYDVTTNGKYLDASELSKESALDADYLLSGAQPDEYLAMDETYGFE